MSGPFPTVLAPSDQSVTVDKTRANAQAAAAPSFAQTKKLHQQQSFHRLIAGQLSVAVRSISQTSIPQHSNSVTMTTLAQLFIPLAIQGSPMGAAAGGAVAGGAAGGTFSHSAKSKKNKAAHKPGKPQPARSPR